MSLLVDTLHLDSQLWLVLCHYHISAAPAYVHEWWRANTASCARHCASPHPSLVSSLSPKPCLRSPSPPLLLQIVAHLGPATVAEIVTSTGPTMVDELVREMGPEYTGEPVKGWVAGWMSLCECKEAGGGTQAQQIAFWSCAGHVYTV